jgi:hypothetical protein
MEDHVRPGLVHITDTDVTQWRQVETLDEVELPEARTDGPVRLLLLVHGTFSSTVGGFAALALNEDLSGFLRELTFAYDAVIGFDHRTLSLDPRQNAEDLLSRLRTYRPDAEVVIDVITHSRGGLVTRSFIEQVLPGSDWPGRTDVAIFVAATNAGTHLADPERWSDLVDLYTNLAAVSAGGLALVPGAAPVAAVVGGLVRGIGAFVKYLVSYAAEGADVPGLKAMVPDGAFVTEINELQPGQPAPGTSWFVVSSNFHVSLFDDSHNPPEFPRELAVKLKEGFVDQLFEGDNDLVVDTSSMAAIGLPGGGFVRDSFELGENDLVHHNNYFDQVAVIGAMAGWLPTLGLGAGGGEEEAMADDGPPESMPDSMPDSMPEPRMSPPVAPPAPPPGRPRSANGGGQRAEPPVSAPPEEPVVRSAPPPTEPTRASLAAEMPHNVTAGNEFTVRVRLSRRALVASDGTVHAEQDIEVDAARPITVQLIGKSNAEVVGTDNDVFALPPGGGTSELQFNARALEAGPLVLRIVLRQGTVPVATLTLEATAFAPADFGLMPLATTTTASAHMGVDAPELDGLPCLDIVERELPGGSVVYQYAVRLEKGAPVARFESKPIKDRVRRIGIVLDDVSKVWRSNDADPAERMRKLQDIGAKLFDEFFPPDMQAHLWEHRNQVRDLIVYADEPFVPWELVHLKPPTGPRQTKPRFLAQSGLVRWQLGSFPPREIQVRQGRARSLCPAYRDPRFTLTEPVFEQRFLEDRFGATPVTATPAGVRDLLRSGKFDLLHFSGHGAADLDDILEAKLLLQGRKHGADVQPQYLGATAVSENASPAADGTGPLVVLNACQVGRAGELLTTVGGFAKAFLDAGASAFVSCLWSVHEQPSRVFVERLYEELLAGQTMAAASVRAREAAREAGDATWLAFVVYARPDAVLART